MLGDNEYQGWAIKTLPIVQLEDAGMYFGWGIQWSGHELEAGDSKMSMASSLWGSGAENGVQTHSLS